MINYLCLFFNEQIFIETVGNVGSVHRQEFGVYGWYNKHWTFQF